MKPVSSLTIVFLLVLIHASIICIYEIKVLCVNETKLRENGLKDEIQPSQRKKNEDKITQLNSTVTAVISLPGRKIINYPILLPQYVQLKRGRAATGHVTFN
jgi:hypothetical protein